MRLSNVLRISLGTKLSQKIGEIKMNKMQKLKKYGMIMTAILFGQAAVTILALLGYIYLMVLLQLTGILPYGRYWDFLLHFEFLITLDIYVLLLTALFDLPLNSGVSVSEIAKL